jgi:ariadne-1
MNSVIESTVVCECGTEVCRHCGSEGHWPLMCLDLRSWNEMTSGREDQWINSLVTQKCPMCRQSIEKNEGCIHMTCVCKYEFCWICLKVWKGHSGYYACADLSRDDHEKKLKEEQAKRSLDETLYSERLEEARGETERLTLSTKRITNTSLEGLVKKLDGIQVLSIHSDLLKEMREFIKKAWGLVYRSSICNFFDGEKTTVLKRVVFRINKLSNEMDDFLS